ncbi:5404_t:CDS:2, partial [Gigaspora rosea]
EINVAKKIISGVREDPINGTPIDFMNLYRDAWNDDPNSRPDIDEIWHKLNLIRLSPVYDSTSVTKFEYKSFKNRDFIGIGSFCIVYSAYSEDIGQTVALKNFFDTSTDKFDREVANIDSSESLENNSYSISGGTYLFLTQNSSKSPYTLKPSDIHNLVESKIESSTVAFQTLNIAISKDDNLKSAATNFQNVICVDFRKTRNTVSNSNDHNEINVKIKKFIEVEESFVTFFRSLSRNKYAPENFEKKVAARAVLQAISEDSEKKVAARADLQAISEDSCQDYVGKWLYVVR